jgi:phosphoglycerate dehydrogenase-like enzyme
MAAQALEKMPGVRWVQSTWAGIAPLLSCRRPRLQLTGVKGVFGSQMSEYVFAYLLAHETRLLKRLKWQQEKRWESAPSGQLRNKTLCIMGTGSIGQHVASVAQLFELRVLGFSRSGASTEGFERVYQPESLAEFLAEADYLVAVLPDTPQTRYLLDARAFRAMKKSAYLVNIGRGNLVDEHALAEALELNELAGAALDVFQHEPLPPDNPLWSARNCLITAHISASSWPADIARIFIRNYLRFQRGEPLEHLVDMDRGY